MFVGYPFGKKGWRLFDLDNEQFFVSRDVRFQEDVFPFKETEEVNLTPTTTTLEAIDDDWIMPAIPVSSIPLVEITTPENENPSEEPHPASDIPVTLEISSSSPSGKPPSPDVSSSTSPSPVVAETKDTPTAPAEILGRG